LLKNPSNEFLLRKRSSSIRKVASRKSGDDVSVFRRLLLTFSERFWPSRLNGVVCADTLIPEMWFEHPERVGELTKYSKQNPNEKKKKPSKDTYVVAAFATSDFADRATALPEKELIRRILQQLDDMFHDNQGFKLYGHSEAHPKTNIPNPASKFFLEYRIQDWSKEPFIKGGYSHPAMTANKKIRETLAAPIQNRVFWAGEATHPKAYMTMHGAIETGDFAAKELMEVLEISPSSTKKSSPMVQSKL